MAGNSVVSGIAIKDPALTSRGESGKDTTPAFPSGKCISVPGVTLDKPMCSGSGK